MFPEILFAKHFESWPVDASLSTLIFLESCTYTRDRYLSGGGSAIHGIYSYKFLTDADP